MSEVDWWDVVATTQAAAEDGHGLFLHLWLIGTS